MNLLYKPNERQENLHSILLSYRVRIWKKKEHQLWLILNNDHPCSSCCRWSRYQGINRPSPRRLSHSIGNYWSISRYGWTTSSRNKLQTILFSKLNYHIYVQISLSKVLFFVFDEADRLVIFLCWIIFDEQFVRNLECSIKILKMTFEKSKV